MNLTQGASFIMANSSGLLLSRDHARSNHVLDNYQIQNAFII